MIRIGFVLDWNVHASSLMNINRNLFREIGKLMNKTKSFTIATIKESSIGIGDINQHYDLVHIPNMGGYRFALKTTVHCNNIIFGCSGIDEIVYGKDILVWKGSWNAVKKEISKEITYWKKYIDKIKYIHVTSNSELEEFHKYLNIPDRKSTRLNSSH